MKTPFRLLIVLCPAIIIIIAAKPSTVNNEYLSIQQAAETGEIKLKITAIGQIYSGDCLYMEISNTLDDTGYYKLEAGRRLHADDSTAQDILVTKEKRIRLAPGEKQNISVFGFCCQAHHHSPHEKANYSVGKMADAGLVQLAQYLNAHNYSTFAMQRAVWVVSDNNALASITCDNMDSVTELRKTVAGIKHIKIPWYGLIYEVDTSRLFTGKCTRITGLLNYYVSNNGIVNISVYDSYGMLVETLSDGPANPDSYTYQLSLDVRGWAKGRYHICITVDENKTVDKIFEL